MPRKAESVPQRRVRAFHHGSVSLRERKLLVGACEDGLEIFLAGIAARSSKIPAFLLVVVGDDDDLFAAGCRPVPSSWSCVVLTFNTARL